MRLPRRLLAVALFLTLAATIVPPAAVADHVYSHRYYVYGRVIDKAGFPVKGVTLQIKLEGQSADFGDCTLRPPLPQPTTDDNGDYLFCRHVDTRIAPRATYELIVPNYPGLVPKGELDQNLRKNRVDIQLTNDEPDKRGNLNFSRSYSLWVTLWQPGPTGLENIQVEGVSLSDRDITVDFTYNGGKTISKTATTDDYGDARVNVDLTEPLTSGTVKVTATRGVTAEATLDAKDFASTVNVLYPGKPWYSNTNLLIGVILFGLLAAGGVGYAIYRAVGSRGEAKVGRRARR